MVYVELSILTTILTEWFINIIIGSLIFVSYFVSDLNYMTPWDHLFKEKFTRAIYVVRHRSVVASTAVLISKNSLDDKPTLKFIVNFLALLG